KRKESDSRSYSLQITAKFHQYFQIEQLPEILTIPAKEQQLSLDLEDSLGDLEVNTTETKLN
ncbi:MAG: hypothetical protein ACKN9K_29050, partial [Dolichospermum sp.]